MNRVGSLGRLASAAGLFVASLLAGSCGDLTGPVSPSTPVDVTAALISPTSARVSWAASPQSDGVISYNIFRNGTKVGESDVTTYTDTGLAPTTSYVYTVSANCKSGVLSEQSIATAASTVITTDVTPPRVISNQPPANSTVVSLGATATVTFSEPVDPATVNTSSFNLRVTATGALVPGTVTYDAETRTATFRPAGPLVSQTNYTGTVTTAVKDVAGNPMAANHTWTFTTADQLSPTIIATSPLNGAVGVAPSSTVSVTFSEPMDPASITSTSFTLRLTSSGSVVPGTVAYNPATRVATFTPTAPLAASTSYTATVAESVRDLAGNTLGANFQFAFSTGDTIAPTVVSTFPADLASNVPTTVVLSATFSEAMDPATINTTTFTLRVTAGGAPVAGTVAYNAATTTATFTPATALAGNTTYTATVSTGARDLAGNPLAASRTWTFITADNTPPTVIAVSPANNATGVATNSSVTVTFSEPMNATTINTTTFNLRNTVTGVVVAGSVAYNTATNSATFTPAGPLANSTNYTVTVTTGVRDAGGNALGSQFTSSFTTAAVADTTAPTVVSTTPPHLATNVATTTPVSVSFSEPMNASTINSTTVRLTVTSSGAAVAGIVEYNGVVNQATFTPASPLANGTGYTITVTTGVRDVAGNPLASQFTSTFTTISDSVAPTVLSTTPASNAVNVPRNSTVTVMFSENMDKVSVETAGTFTLRTTTAGVIVPGTVSYNVATRIATFTPTTLPLLPSTSYTATVTTAAKDVAGNGLAGNFAFSFTTAP